jgi:hypothetical protein
LQISGSSNLAGEYVLVLSVDNHQRREHQVRLNDQAHEA